MADTFDKGNSAVLSTLATIEDMIKGEEDDPVTGDTYFVATTGNDATGDGTSALPWLTIDYAIGQCTADNDDQIIVLPGTYDENANTAGVVVDVAGITIKGAQFGSNKDSVNVVNSNGAATAVFTVSVDNVTIDNLAIPETTVTVEGIVSTGDNCTFNGLYISGAMENGIHLTATTYNIINNCRINSCTNDGIEISGVAIRNFIIGCQINACTDSGININGAGSDNNLIDDTKIDGEGTTTNGIIFTDSDDNVITHSVYVTRCTTGINLAAGSQNNTLGANTNKNTTQVLYASGNNTNALGPSITQIHRDIHHIVSFSGNVYYVDGTNGDDTNHNGKHPEAALATIGAAITAASAGDKIVVKAMTSKYDEAGLDLNLQGTELWFEEGAILEDTGAGTVLTVSAQDCRLVNVFIDNDDNGGIGFNVTTAASIWMENCTAIQCTVGFQLDGVKGRFYNCHAIDNTTTGFDIQTIHALFQDCTANGNAAAVRGFYLSDNTADLNAFINCHTLANTTSGWETVAGADNNLFTRCSSGTTDGARVDTGTNNSWPGMLEGTDYPIGKSCYDIVGTNYLDAGGAFNTDSLGDDLNTLGTYIMDGTAGAEAGSTLPAGKSIIDVLGTEYVDAGGNPDVDTIRDHLQGGLLNGTGSTVPANKSLVDMVGAVYVDGAGGWNTENVADDINRVGQYIMDGTAGAEAGSTLPAGKSLVDVVGTEYVDAGGNPDVDTVRDHLQSGLLNGTGTVLPANKSILDALGTDGTTPVDSATSVLGAIGVNDADNAMDTSNVVANEDGSVFERLETIQGAISVGTGTALPANSSLYDMVFKSESPQTGTITLTTQNTWYSVFTPYTSTDYTVEGTVTLDFPINQTYEVRITRHAAGRNPGAVAQYVIGGTAESRTFVIGPTQYLDVEARCTTAGAIAPTWDRVLKYGKDTGAIAPT